MLVYILIASNCIAILLLGIVIFSLRAWVCEISQTLNQHMFSKKLIDAHIKAHKRLNKKG